MLHNTKLEWFARDKHSSLLGPFISVEENKVLLMNTLFSAKCTHTLSSHFLLILFYVICAYFSVNFKPCSDSEINDKNKSYVLVKNLAVYANVYVNYVKRITVFVISYFSQNFKYMHKACCVRLVT
jgi:hypothetical protein